MLKIKSLEEMKNGYYLHNTREYLIIDYQNNGKQVIINTNKGDLSCDLTDLKNYLTEFLLIKKGSVELVKNMTDNIDDDLPVFENISTASLDVITRKNKDAPNLVELVLENIKKVRESRDFIPQAKSINDSINIILNMAKMEIILRKIGKY